MTQIPEDQQQRQEALRRIARQLLAQGQSRRQIARGLGLHRQTVKKLLKEEPPEEGPASPAPIPALKKPPKSSLLDPFRDRLAQLAEVPDLTNQSILLTLRQEGYAGGKTILDQCLRELRGPDAGREKTAFARYEPAPGREAQMDWSPWTVKLGQEPVKIHVFSLILSWSRCQYLEAFLDEKQDTIFQGHVEAFRYFQGVPAEILYDNQAAIVVGRIEHLPLIHRRFQAFANHYGFAPRACAPYDCERKGRVERPFGYLDSSFFPGRTFSGLEDLRRQLRSWLEGEGGALPVGNWRVHGTTRQRPADRWREVERDLLIRLPQTDFMPTRIETRLVGKDCLIQVMGNSFTVPPALVGQEVTVLISPRGIRVFNSRREPVAEHLIPAGKGRMVINEDHYAALRRRREYQPSGSLEDQFLAAFPKRRDFLEALKLHLKSIAPIHLRHLMRLAQHFTRDQLDFALAQAAAHGVCTSTYAEEILERRWPGQVGARRFLPDSTSPARALKLGQLDLGDSSTFARIFPDSQTNQPKGD